MRQAVIAVLGIILIYAGISKRWEVFYRIRRMPLYGTGALIMRIIYIAAGAALIVMTISGQV